MGQRYVIDRAERVTAILQLAHSRTSESRGECLWRGPGVDFGQRIPLWCGPGEANSTHGSLSEIQAGINREHWEADYGPRPGACFGAFLK